MLPVLFVIPAALGLAFLAKTSVVAFACVAAFAGMIAAVTMERERFLFEFPFYFAKPPGPFAMGYIGVASSFSVLLKTILAGGLAYLFFSGTGVKESVQRIEITAYAFAISLSIGAFLLAVLQYQNPAVRRWGYFRLALPLGVLYSAVMHIWPKSKSFWFWDNIEVQSCLNPSRYKTLGKASDCYFEVSQTIDHIVETVLRGIELPGVKWRLPDWLVEAVAVVGSSNIAMGFVLAPLAVLLIDVFTGWSGARKSEID